MTDGLLTVQSSRSDYRAEQTQKQVQQSLLRVNTDLKWQRWSASFHSGTDHCTACKDQQFNKFEGTGSVQQRGPRHQAWGPYLAEQYLPERSSVGVRLGSLLRCQPADCGRPSAQLPIARTLPVHQSVQLPVVALLTPAARYSARSGHGPAPLSSCQGRPAAAATQHSRLTAPGRRGPAGAACQAAAAPLPCPASQSTPRGRRRRRFPAAARAVCWPAADRPGQGRGGGEGRPAAVCREH